MMMKNFVILLLVWVFVSCENPYENVSEDKQYTGNPFVSLSSEQASVDMGINQNNNQSLQAGVFKDSIVLSHVLDTDLTVMLERVEDESFGEVGTHFDFQDTLTIKSGENYGVFYVSGLSIAVDEISKYKLAVRIKEVDNENVIGGLYGVKKENEPREKRFKTYSFQKY
jgi:hypothetical protein